MLWHFSKHFLDVGRCCCCCCCFFCILFIYLVFKLFHIYSCKVNANTVVHQPCKSCKINVLIIPWPVHQFRVVSFTTFHISMNTFFNLLLSAFASLTSSLCRPFKRSGLIFCWLSVLIFLLDFQLLLISFHSSLQYIFIFLRVLLFYLHSWIVQLQLVLLLNLNQSSIYICPSFQQKMQIFQLFLCLSHMCFILINFFV